MNKSLFNQVITYWTFTTDFDSSPVYDAPRYFKGRVEREQIQNVGNLISLSNINWSFWTLDNLDGDIRRTNFIYYAVGEFTDSDPTNLPSDADLGVPLFSNFTPDLRGRQTLYRVGG